MEIIRTADGKQALKVTKANWEAIGEKAGWMKAAQASPGSPSEPPTDGSNVQWGKGGKGFPVDTCPKCYRPYWACATCGASPLPGDENTPPTRCSNKYCSNPKFVYTKNRYCCQKDYHHLGQTCQHCGMEG